MWRGAFELSRVLPPRPSRRALCEIDDGFERVEHARILPAIGEGAKLVEHLVRILPPEIVLRPNAEEKQVFRHARSDIGELLQLLEHRLVIAHASAPIRSRTFL